MNPIRTFLAIFLVLGAQGATYSQQSSLYVTGPSELNNLGGRTLLLNGDNTDSWLTFHDYNDDWFSMGMDYSDGRKFKINRGGNLGDYNHFTLTLDGQLGLGVSSPYTHARLQVKAPTVSPWGLIVEASSNQRIIGISHDGSVGVVAVSALGSEGFSPLQFRTENIPRMTIDTNGEVGIGTTSPESILDVRGNYINVVNSGYTFIGRNAAPGSDAYFFTRTTNNYQIIGSNKNGSAPLRKLGFAVGGNDNEVDVKMTIDTNGDVGIGTSSPDSKLTVKGIIHAEEVKVDLNVPGPDYVFEDGYPLASLEDTKAYIEQNKHLPGIPSSAEMQQNGVNLLEMNMKLLEKVEVLTLHLIDLQSQVTKLKNEKK